jgi:SAM-dependent methyltransferase
MVRLNIGAGKTYLPGFTNVDIAPHAELTLDMSTDKLPFEDDSVDLVFSYGTLEHIEDYLAALREIYRVLKHGAPFLLSVPYVSLTYNHQVNPYHLHDFNEKSFDFFDPRKGRGSAAEEATEESPILFRRAFHRYHYMGAFKFLPRPLQEWSRRHLMNTVAIIDFGVVAIKDEGLPVQFDARTLEAEFDRLCAARVPYEHREQPNGPRGEVSLLRHLANREYHRLAARGVRSELGSP